jgi:hypothetical protein
VVAEHVSNAGAVRERSRTRRVIQCRASSRLCVDLDVDLVVDLVVDFDGDGNGDVACKR